MIVPSELARSYDDLCAALPALQGKVELLLRGAARAVGARFAGIRLKPLPSALLKLYKDAPAQGLAGIQDFLAATIVVPDQTYIPRLKEELANNFVVDAQTAVKTNRPEEFIYDDLHLLLHLKAPGPEIPYGHLQFELQVKTDMQNASATVARQLSYKTKTLSWTRARLASRIRALVEMVDDLLVRIQETPEDQDESSTPYKLYVIRNKIISVCRESFSPSELPEDLRRLSIVIDDILRECKPPVSADELKALLSHNGFTSIREAQSISIVDKVLIAVYKANRISRDVNAGDLRGEKSYIISDEMISLCPELKKIPTERRINLAPSVGSPENAPIQKGT
ncbi:MAG TPA: hypothetical protein VN176_17990 [Verrucomicrobiae bacterium]|jgi:ppGpp synthetase/RelA/SpoT-type nucleotidyltranferase|nr:hypothetical protein [Verrucomicrobiae bacterium]